MTTKSKRGGLREPRGGRPPQIDMTKRALWGGKVRIGISPEYALKLQALMLRRVEGVETPEQLIEYLIDHADLPTPPDA